MPIEFPIKLDLTGSATEITKVSCKAFERVMNLLLYKSEVVMDRFKALAEAQTQFDIKALASGDIRFQDGQLVESEPNQPIANQILQAEQEHELGNLVENLKVAFQALDGVPDEEISDDEVDPDFFARWRQGAKVIGRKDLKEAWGRLLAEEIKKPESISYQTLDAVKNLTRRDAELFCEYAPLVADRELIVAKASGKMVFIDFLTLLECGLVTPTFSTAQYTPQGTVISEPPKQSAFFKGHALVNDSEQKFTLSGARLTRAGKELYDIADYDPMSSDQYPYLFEGVSFTSGVKLYSYTDGTVHMDTILYDQVKKK